MVMPNKVIEQHAAAGGGAEDGRRPTTVPVPAAANPELSERPRRRSFTARDKLRILTEADLATDPGEIGALLRREGLYSSTLTDLAAPARGGHPRRPDACTARPEAEPAQSAGRGAHQGAAG